MRYDAVHCIAAEGAALAAPVLLFRCGLNDLTLDDIVETISGWVILL